MPEKIDQVVYGFPKIKNRRTVVIIQNMRSVIKMVVAYKWSLKVYKIQLCSKKKRSHRLFCHFLMHQSSSNNLCINSEHVWEKDWHLWPSKKSWGAKTIMFNAAKLYFSMYLLIIYSDVFEFLFYIIMSPYGVLY